MSLKHRVTSFFRETQLSGFGYIANSKTLTAKAFWGLILGSCLLGLVYHVYHAVIDHIHTPPTTAYTVLPRAQIKLPDPIVCLDAYFDRAKTDAMSVSPSLGRFMQYSGFFSNIRGRGYRRPDDSFLAAADYAKFEDRLNLSFSQIADKLSFDPSDIFIYGCSVSGKHLNCAKSAQKIWVLFGTGVCFRLAPHNQTIAGPGGGLSTTFTTMKHRHYTLVNGADDEDKIHGAFLYLSTEGSLGETPVHLSSQWNTHIGLNLIGKKLLSAGNSRCSNDPLRGNAACSAKCVVTFLNCSCVPLDFTDTMAQRSHEACSPTDFAQCVVRAMLAQPSLQNLIEGLEDDLHPHLLPCVKKCGVNCDNWSVEKTVSGFPLSRKGASDDIVKFDMYYRNLEAVVIEEQDEAAPAKLFGIVGGLLGFWVGGSVIAVAHCICYWFVGETQEREEQSVKCSNGQKRQTPGTNDRTVMLFRGQREFRRFLRSTLLHGFGYCLRSINDKLMHFWPIIVASCSVALAVQVFKSTIGYAYQKPSTRYSVIPQQKMDLPAVVLCTEGHFDTNKVGPTANVSAELARFLLHGFAMYPTNNGHRLSMDTMQRLNGDFRRYLRFHDTTFTKLVDELSAHTDGLVARTGFCRLSAFAHRHKFNRCIVGRFWSWPGKCVELQPAVNYRGAPYGFEAVVASAISELRFPELDGNKKNGAYLFLSMDGEIDQAPVFLPRASLVKVTLNPALVKTLPTGENGCVHASTFSYDTCIFRCKVKANLGECNCTSIDAITVEAQNSSVCNPLEVVQCQIAARESQGQHVNARKSAITSCITNGCRQSCVRFTYRKTVTIIRYIFHLAFGKATSWCTINRCYQHDCFDRSSRQPVTSAIDIKFNGNRWTKRSRGYTEDNYSKLRLSYETTDLLVIEQFYSTSFGDFIGVIGGHCGLWTPVFYINIVTQTQITKHIRAKKGYIVV